VKLEKRMQELQTLLSGPVAAASAPQGISEETRKAMPTEADLKNLKDLGVGEKNGDNAKRNEFYRARQAIVDKLYLNTSKWSDEDFKARLDAEVKINKVVQDATGSSWGSNMWESWVTFASESKTPEIFARRMKALPDLMKQSGSFYGNSYAGEKTRHALHAYLQRNASTYASVPAKKQFCDWLKSNGVTNPAIDEYKNDLDNGTASAVKERNPRRN
jgi:hypothetical protein